MVTDVAPDVEAVDPVPVEETESPVEEVQLPDEVAAPEAEEAATDPIPEEIPQVQSDPLAEMREQLETLQRQIAENERRQRQSRNAKEAQERVQKQLQKDQAELEDRIAATLIRQGYTDPDAKAISQIIEQGFDKRADQHFARLTDDVDVALDSLLMGKVEADELSERQQQMMNRLQKKIGEWFPAARKMIEDEARKDYVPRADIPKLVQAEIERRNAKAREGTTELKRPEGTPVTGETFEALESIYASGEATPAQEAKYRQMRRERGL